MEDIINKVNIAKSVQDAWAYLELEDRTKILNDVYKSLENSSEEIAKLISLEIGKPITQARGEVKSTLNNIKWDLDNAHKYISPEITFENEKEVDKVFYEPKGLVAVISPFNYPFSLCCVITFQNLIVGNVVINKPDNSTPQLYKLLEQIFNNSELPKGVQQFIFGNEEAGMSLVEQDINMICFTGSTNTGKYLYNVAANKMIPILMELGGSAPGIICEDANIDEIIEGVFKKKFSNSGQLCHALKRLIVHESKFEEVIEKLKNISYKQIIGNPLNEETTMGPLVSEKQLNKLLDQFNDAIEKGAKVICGGKKSIGLEGNYFEPTLLTNITKNMRVWNEEVFGPILPIVSFKNIDEAIELANDTIYGLGGYVFTTDKELFQYISKRIKTGMISCNNLAYSAPYNPFGGVKLSGLGRTRGEWGFKELCDIKIVTFEK